MPIRVHDTMARKLVPLAERDPGKVRIYVCGPTVYNYVHIGNARTLLWFDLIRRYLRYRGYDVTLVMNYTDVDDKIIERASLEGSSPEVITAKYGRAFEDDMNALGVSPPDILCRATDHIDDMVAAIDGLITSGVAYEAEGNVFFSVEAFPGYGKLSGRTLEDMRAGERIEPHSAKRNPLDFALWKAAKEGEPAWDSPWGKGRPGWHIECSVMSTKYLDMGFDLHGGASDLIFPHHENEIAQAEALHSGARFVRHWLHAGLVQMDEEKMSKSLGNVVLARDAVEAYGAGPARYWAASASYRSQVVMSPSALQDAAQAYGRWKTFAQAARHVLGDDAPASGAIVVRRAAGDEDTGSSYVTRFIEAMDDDFNSAGAFAALHELVSEGNRALPDAQRGDEAARAAMRSLLSDFLELTGVLGLSFVDALGANDELVGGLIDLLLDLRETARSERAFARADEIRDRLDELGVQVEDTPAGPRWRIGVAGS